MIDFHGHLHQISNKIPPLDSSAEILLLIGRDVPEAHHVESQIIWRKVLLLLKS